MSLKLNVRVPIAYAYTHSEASVNIISGKHTSRWLILCRKFCCSGIIHTCHLKENNFLKHCSGQARKLNT